MVTLSFGIVLTITNKTAFEKVNKVLKDGPSEEGKGKGKEGCYQFFTLYITAYYG
jgi:hypothetical protein